LAALLIGIAIKAATGSPLHERHPLVSGAGAQKRGKMTEGRGNAYWYLEAMETRTRLWFY
jgi:hypothetical protein